VISWLYLEFVVPTMEIDISTLPDAQALKQFLENHLGIGKATVRDTQEFLSQQNLGCSEEIKQDDKHFQGVMKVLNYTNPSYLQFDSVIGCKIPIKPKRINTRNPIVWLKAFWTSGLVTWDYMVRFHFEKGILVEIFTQRVGTGF
jgi:hypothetical protein